MHGARLLVSVDPPQPSPERLFIVTQNRQGRVFCVPQLTEQQHFFVKRRRYVRYGIPLSPLWGVHCLSQ